ncbi:hypothetical protein [Vibrio sp. LaRot3]|uniref:hypothetical protein n=1 Tax=Vibrio sp. LaRot3 TaxID=2998829 RepID=UPI0022CDE34B|nr:hypothetical protein [Vibrio sp. LaRot3]MDA0147373.1 hypothetical protein [Vibrio sp. LaRot3]
MIEQRLEQLNATLANEPNNIPALYERALWLAGDYIANDECLYDEHAQNYRQSLEDLDKIIELDPKHALAQYHKACIYFSLDIDDEEAESLLYTALELEPNNVDAMYKYAEVITYNGENSDHGVALMDRVIAIDPSSSAYMMKGVYLMGDAEYNFIICDIPQALDTLRLAITNFEHAINLDPEAHKEYGLEKIEECLAQIKANS